MQVIEAQSQAARTLTQMYKGMDASKLDEKMDKVRDALADADDVSRALNQQLVITDDSDVADDLAALQDEIAEEEADSLAAASRTKVSPASKQVATAARQPPTVSTKADQKKKVEEDEDLSALEAELAAWYHVSNVIQ